MNPDDIDYRELQSCMYNFLEAEDDEGQYAANPEFVAVCQRILKREWEVTKREIRSLDKAFEAPSRN